MFTETFGNRNHCVQSKCNPKLYTEGIKNEDIMKKTYYISLLYANVKFMLEC
jgi:hypothetical protein